MKLYLISQSVNDSYDTYSEAVVASNFEEDARRIHPNPYHEIGAEDHWYFVYTNGGKKKEGLTTDDWCAVSDVTVKYIGEAAEGIERGVVLTSFHAG